METARPLDILTASFAISFSSRPDSPTSYLLAPGAQARLGVNTLLILPFPLGITGGSLVRGAHGGYVCMRTIAHTYIQTYVPHTHIRPQAAPEMKTWSRSSIHPLTREAHLGQLGAGLDTTSCALAYRITALSELPRFERRWRGSLPRPVTVTITRRRRSCLLCHPSFHRTPFTSPRSL